jgi:flagellin-specific chaperone FliS
VDHALLVLDQLQRGLDMTSGGEAAANMARLYSLTRVGLLRAQIRSDASLLTRFLEIFLSLRQAWQNAGASRATVSAADTSDENASRRDNLTTAWTA